MSIFFSQYFPVALALAVALYWLLPRTYRMGFLTAGSVALLCFLQPFATLFFLAMTPVIFLAARRIESSKSGLLLGLSIAGLVIVLLGGKYADEIVAAVQPRQAAFAERHLAFIGISYLVFKLIAYLIDVYRGQVKPDSLQKLVLFVFFVPIFPAGPIQRYQEFNEPDRSGLPLAEAVPALLRICFGFFKKLIVLGVIIDPMALAPMAERVNVVGPLGSIASADVVGYLVLALIYAYIDLSAYADLAIGTSRLFGYRIMENMNLPILRPNIAEYWRCWHISLSSWCRNNVYMPVLGKWRNPTLALYASFLVMGLWHGVSSNWVVWGLWHATGIWVYTKWRRTSFCHQLNEALPQPLAYAIGTCLTVLFSALGFAFIMSSSAAGAFRLLAEIFI